MKTKLTALIALLVCGCGGVKVEQEVSLKSITNCSYYVSTYIRVYSWSGMPRSLEYWKQEVCFYSQIDSIKQAEKQKALSVIDNIIECL